MATVSYLTMSVPRRNVVRLDNFFVVMASCLTMFVWNRIAEVEDSVVMVMASS